MIDTSVSSVVALLTVRSVRQKEVFDVLEQQSRSALLPDAIISTISGQITIQVRYESLECKDIVVNQKPDEICKLPTFLSVHGCNYNA
ncbi:hypothetical protein KIN20_035690 [Parelaphostrongylus tenuis]|uniref:Uncharacterized protein n=1 Tax=Parelaphostrongylus tenuis TaxID=148309 RepID=A0AAD5RBZ6_PARTN|nr:hypothetical protein KIN20_035690 [Parelaphostrongylus tenuis]